MAEMLTVMEPLAPVVNGPEVNQQGAVEVDLGSPATRAAFARWEAEFAENPPQKNPGEDEDDSDGDQSIEEPPYFNRLQEYKLAPRGEVVPIRPPKEDPPPQEQPDRKAAFLPGVITLGPPEEEPESDRKDGTIAPPPIARAS